MQNQPPYNDPNNPQNPNPYNQQYNQNQPPPYGGGQNQPPYGGQMQNNPYGGGQVDVPNATVILVLGIVSIVICGLGPILGTIALVMYSGAKKIYEQNPGAYTQSSFNNLNAGRICGIIGLILGSLIWLYYIVVLVIFGTMMGSVSTWDRY
ncbi:MAG: hypothetical protein FD123_2296 [Bacteroidetes bacterium]|nr:MAG: hypothetical protein FD123_2296 [Bacteroidota bacterium]